MGRMLSGSRGLAGIGLVFVIAWALLAVLLLTGTLVAAHNIRNDVSVINPRLTAINGNTGNVRLAAQTAELTGRIKAAAQPLSGELSSTLTAAGQIKQSADKILGTAQQINGQVSKIHTTVFAIGSTVDAINGNVQAIGANVSSIGAHVQSIGASVDSVNAHVQSVNANVNAIHDSVQSIHSRALSILSKAGPINRSVVSILGTARSINSRVRMINGRADQIFASIALPNGVTPDSTVKEVNGINDRARIVQSVAQGIQADLASVLADVGLNDALATIDGNANAIDCSTLLNAVSIGPIPLGGPTRGCNRGAASAVTPRLKSPSPAAVAQFTGRPAAASAKIPGIPPPATPKIKSVPRGTRTGR